MAAASTAHWIHGEEAVRRVYPASVSMRCKAHKIGRPRVHLRLDRESDTEMIVRSEGCCGAVVVSRPPPFVVIAE